MPTKKRRRYMKQTSIQTQTEALPNLQILRTIFQPVVLLNRLSPDTIKDLNINKFVTISNLEENQLRGKCRGQSSTRLSRVPTDYTKFVKPITNNQKVNSTLVLGQEISVTVVPENKEIKTKPGPRCYKEKIQRRMAVIEEEETAKQYDSEIQGTLTENSLKHASLTKPTKIYKERLNEAMLPIEEQYSNSNQDLLLLLDGVRAEPDEVATPINSKVLQKLQNSTPVAFEESPTVNRVERNCSTEIFVHNAENSETPKIDKPKNIKFQFNGITTVISDGGSGDRGSCDEDADFEREVRGSRFVKITASTVHIHNHFYNSSEQ